jgi:hypothetical protein
VRATQGHWGGKGGLFRKTSLSSILMTTPHPPPALPLHNFYIFNKLNRIEVDHALTKSDLARLTKDLNGQEALVKGEPTIDGKPSERRGHKGAMQMNLR